MQILSVIKRHGYRLEDVATMLGITKGSLSATINGSPNVKKLIDIALIIGCSPAEFFDDWYENEGKEQKKRPTPDPSLGESGVDTPEQQDDALPFGNSPQPSALAHQPSLQQAIVCPHCGKAMTITVQG